MTDLACRNTAVGVPVLHSSHMAACCRTSPCADDKASTPFLTEKMVVSREFMELRQAHQDMSRASHRQEAGEEQGDGAERDLYWSRTGGPGRYARQMKQDRRTISYFPVRVDDAAGLLRRQVVDVGTLMLLRHCGEPRSRRRRPQPKLALNRVRGTASRVESSRVAPVRVGMERAW